MLKYNYLRTIKCFIYAAFQLISCNLLLTDILRSQPISSVTIAETENQYSHYAIVIDAGSSGSRAYLYAWPSHSGDMHELLKIRPLVSKMKSNLQTEGSSSSSSQEEPLVEKVTPGLSRLVNLICWNNFSCKMKLAFRQHFSYLKTLD